MPKGRGNKVNPKPKRPTKFDNKRYEAARKKVFGMPEPTKKLEFK